MHDARQRRKQLRSAVVGGALAGDLRDQGVDGRSIMAHRESRVCPVSGIMRRTGTRAF